jgi:hypothetical protein
MANGWTPERRQRQREAIQRWRPWERSTGPRTPQGHGRCAAGRFKGGVRPALRELARLLRQQRQVQREVKDR